MSKNEDLFRFNKLSYIFCWWCTNLFPFLLEINFRKRNLVIFGILARAHRFCWAFQPLFYSKDSFSWRIIFHDCFASANEQFWVFCVCFLVVLMITFKRNAMSSCMQVHTQGFFHIGRYAEAWAQMEEWKCWRMLLSDVFSPSHLNLKQIYATRRCMSFRWSFWGGRRSFSNVLCTVDVCHSPFMHTQCIYKNNKRKFP